MILAGVTLSITGRCVLHGRQAFRELRGWKPWANEGGGLPGLLRVHEDQITEKEARCLLRFTDD